jgi:hypothetical protein
VHFNFTFYTYVLQDASMLQVSPSKSCVHFASFHVNHILHPSDPH